VISETYPEYKLKEEAIEEGLKASQPCRLEYVKTSVTQGKTVVLDVAHNQPAIVIIINLLYRNSHFLQEKCMLSLMQRHPGKNFRVIYGSSGHKDTYGCLQALKDYAYKIHVVQAKHSRAKNIGEMLEQVEEVKAELIEEKGKETFEEVVNGGDIASTIDNALEKAKEDEVVVVLGSFYIMAEVRQHFKYNDDIDPVY